MNDLDAIVKMVAKIELQITVLNVMIGFLFGAEVCRLYAAFMKLKNEEGGEQ